MALSPTARTSSPRFGRVITAMITPFDDRGDLDIDGAVELAKWLVGQGNEGLVLAGTTGEAPTLTTEEKRTLWETVAGAVTVPVIAGTTGSNTAADVALTAEASRLGVAGILALCPYYSRPSQAGIDAHLRAIAASTDLPVVIYDIPVRTGRKVSNDVLLGLAREVPNVVAVKDAAGSPSATAELLAEAPAGFEVYSGDDSLTLPLLSIGAVGLIGVATHWVTPDVVEMFDAWACGDVGLATSINQRLIESWRFETGDDAPNPGPAKAMLRHLGVPSGYCRPPMGSDPAWLDDRAVEVYQRLQAARGAEVAA